MTDDASVRPFADFLRDQAKGSSHDELSVALHDLVERVQATGKKGTLTYTVTVAPMSADADAVKVSDEIRLKLPEHDRANSLFFVDRDGNLRRNDPNQLPFEGLREVPEPGEARDVHPRNTTKEA